MAVRSGYFLVTNVAGVECFLVDYPGQIEQSQQILVESLGGNKLLTTSYIVDMNIPRLPQGAKAYASRGKMRDAKGRKIYWD